MNFSEDESDEDEGYEYESYDGYHSENQAEEQALIEQEERRKEEGEEGEGEEESLIEQGGNGDETRPKTRCQRCNASLSVVVTVVLMSCVFVVALYFAYRYNNFAADVEKHSNDTQSIEELERYRNKTGQ